MRQSDAMAFLGWDPLGHIPGRQSLAHALTVHASCAERGATVARRRMYDPVAASRAIRRRGKGAAPAGLGARAATHGHARPRNGPHIASTKAEQAQQAEHHLLPGGPGGCPSPPPGSRPHSGTRTASSGRSVSRSVGCKPARLSLRGTRPLASRKPCPSIFDLVKSTGALSCLPPSTVTSHRASRHAACHAAYGPSGLRRGRGGAMPGPGAGAPRAVQARAARAD